MTQKCVISHTLWVIMRAHLITLFFLLSLCANGQEMILDSLDLDNGEYKFFFVKKTYPETDDFISKLMDGDFKTSFKYSVDSTNSFLITDKTTLNYLKENWIGEAKDEFFVCCSDLHIYVVRKNIIIETLIVDLEHNQVVSSKGTYNFIGNPFDQIENKRQVWVVSSKHEELQEARKYIKRLKPNILLDEKPLWVDYDGYFSVYESYKGEDSLSAFENEILATYSDYNFHIELANSGPKTFSFIIHSDSTFYNVFGSEKKGDWLNITPSWITYFSEDISTIRSLIK